MATVEETMGRDIAHVGDFVKTATGDLDSISGLPNIKSALMHRLLTTPGSFILRPTYGVGIKDYQNGPSTYALQQQLAVRIKEQFEQDPRIDEVTGVRVEFDEAKPELSNIIVKVRLVGYDEVETTFQPFTEGI